jgi:tetratricopeptide (TPR) repeat protein
MSKLNKIRQCKCLILLLLLRGGFLYAQSDSLKSLLSSAEQNLRNNVYSQSLNQAQTAYTLANTEGSVWGMGEAMRYIGTHYRRNDKLPEAEIAYEKAVQLLGKTPFRDRYARCLAELGRIKQDLRNFAEATEMYTQSLAVFNKLSDADIQKNQDIKALVLERMTVLLSNQKQYDQAEIYALEAYQLCEQIGDKGRWQITATAVGNVYFWKKNYEKAAFYYQKAYVLANAIGQNTGRSLNNLGIVAAKAGQNDAAIGYYLQAIEQYKKSKSMDMIAQTQINIAELYNAKKNFGQAIDFGQKGVETIVKLKTVTGLTEGYEVLITAYIQLGDLPKALETQRRFVAIKDSLFANSRQKELLEAQTKFESEKKDKEIQLLNRDKQLKDLALQQQNLALLNQKLLTEKNQNTVKLLQQAKILQESELARTAAELEKEKNISENTITQLSLNQRDRQVEHQQLQLESKNNSILRGVIGGLILLAIGIGWFIGYRQKNRRERELWQQQKMAAENLLNVQTSELKALRSQINPHFIFNCLNAVKSLVLQNQNDAASAYVTKFSRLVRLVLENSRSEWITLEQELETLTLYLDIEQMRFNNRFQYWINLENDVDTEGVKLPPMLIQPYVENAIWHGLMHKEGDGNVTISILEKGNNQLVINILDDGIGRKKAMELKSKTATQRKSFGMEISADRIHIINQIYKTNAQVTVYDLTDETTGEATGTRVQLLLSV